MPETRLEMAKRHVASQKVLIAKQEALVNALKEAHRPTGLALDILETMRRTLATFERDVERLSRN